MQVSVETLDGLERKITVSVPTEKIEEEVNLRLRNLARKVKVDGFRPGKVPLNIVTKRYSDDVRGEVAREMIQSTLFNALEDNDLIPAGSPSVEPQQIEQGKDFEYTALFEVFPAINIEELKQDEIEIVDAVVTEADVDNILEKLREQNKDWQEVVRAAADGDKIIIDFSGYVDEQLMDGGTAKDYEIVIGSKSMISGFEEGLIGHEKDKPFEIKVNFPDDYTHKELAGKEALFKITIHKVMEGQLPALDQAFADKFNINEGGIDALRQDIKDNMTRELERRLQALNREKIFDKLLAANSFEVPKVMIDHQIEDLKHEMYHRVFGHEHSDNEKIPDFPKELFEDSAKRRVHLGLLFSEYVKKHDIKADPNRIDAMIEKFAGAYETPEELRSWYKNDKNRLAEVEALVTEEMVAEKISENAKLINKSMSYDEVMNPKKDHESTGE